MGNEKERENTMVRAAHLSELNLSAVMGGCVEIKVPNNSKAVKECWQGQVAEGYLSLKSFGLNRR